jgi:hypothetical protein
MTAPQRFYQRTSSMDTIDGSPRLTAASNRDAHTKTAIAEIRDPHGGQRKNYLSI